MDILNDTSEKILNACQDCQQAEKFKGDLLKVSEALAPFFTVIHAAETGQMTFDEALDIMIETNYIGRLKTAVGKIDDTLTCHSNCRYMGYRQEQIIQPKKRGRR